MGRTGFREPLHRGGRAHGILQKKIFALEVSFSQGNDLPVFNFYKDTRAEIHNPQNGKDGDFVPKRLYIKIDNVFSGRGHRGEERLSRRKRFDDQRKNSTVDRDKKKGKREISRCSGRGSRERGVSLFYVGGRLLSEENVSS